MTEDKIYKNFLDLIRRLPTKQAEQIKEIRRTSIDKMINDKTIQSQEFPEAYFEWKADKEHLNQSK